MVDTHKCLQCGETMTEEQAKSPSGCPFCYTKKGIVMRSPADVGENHQEKVQMAKKSVPAKAAAKPVADKKAPKVEKVAAKVVEAPVKPVAKKESKPVVKDEITLIDTPAAPAKKGVKAYAEKVLAEKAAKEAPGSAIVDRLKKEKSSEDAKFAEAETARLAALEKKKNSLAAFTKNGAPASTGDDGFDKIQLKAYNDYVDKVRNEIDVLSVPMGKDSPANHVVKFGKDGVARRVSPSDGAKAIAKAAAKPISKQKCVCVGCLHIPAPCPEKCDQLADNCVQVKGTCKTKGHPSCVAHMESRGFDAVTVVALRKALGATTKLPSKSAAAPKSMAPADSPNATKLVARKKA